MTDADRGRAGSPHHETGLSGEQITVQSLHMKAQHTEVLAQAMKVELSE